MTEDKDSTRIATTKWVDGRNDWPSAVAHLGCFGLIGFIAFLLFKACVR